MGSTLRGRETSHGTAILGTFDSVTLKRLEQMVAKGILPSRELIKWCPADGEAVPMPLTGEVVVFTDFFENGFSFPPSSFLRGFLYYYKLELHHLNPNGVLRIASFVTACEAFLGIRPHFALWKHVTTSEDHNRSHGIRIHVPRPSTCNIYPS